MLVKSLKVIWAVGIICLLSFNLVLFGGCALIIALLFRVFKLCFLELALNHLYFTWIKINKFCLMTLTNTKLVLQEASNYDNQSWAVVTCNHVSWADILILQISMGDKLAPLKFFMKDSLIWVPFVGVLAKLLDYPFIKRYSLSQIKAKPARKFANQETVKLACIKLKNQVSSLVIFPEGTRRNDIKLADSKYQHLLSVKAKGLRQIFTYWQDLNPQWHDVSLHYSCKKPTMWRLLAGEIDEVVCQDEVLKFDNNWVDEHSQQSFQHLLNQRWVIKDAWLAKIAMDE